MPEKRDSVAILAWYSQEQLKKLKRRAVDAHLLDDHYEAWLEQMNHVTAQLSEAGEKFAKCYVDIDELEVWCREEGLPLDGQARSRYVTEVARDNYREGDSERD